MIELIPQPFPNPFPTSSWKKETSESMSETDKIFLHEVLHTTHVMMAMFGDHIVDHLAVKKNPRLKVLTSRVEEALSDLYQEVGELRFPNE